VWTPSVDLREETAELEAAKVRHAFNDESISGKLKVLIPLNRKAAVVRTNFEKKAYLHNSVIINFLYKNLQDMKFSVCLINSRRPTGNCRYSSMILDLGTR
jgi:hypothetical protein